MNGDSYRLKHARGSRRKAVRAVSQELVADDVVDQDTNEITSA